MEQKNINKCRACGDYDNLKKVIDIGKVPLAGYFPKHGELFVDKNFDCFLFLCESCGMVQTNISIDSSELFEDYRYASSIGLSKHFDGVAKYLNDRFCLSMERRVLEIGSNDGVLLKPLKDISVSAIGIDPSANISRIAKKKGCEVIVDFFGRDSAKKHFTKNSFDLVVANNVFAHVDDLDSIIEGIKHCMTAGGVFVAEVHYLLDLVSKCQYDFIYHEHIFYHSLFSLDNLFKKHDMSLYDFERIDVHSGSIRIFVKNGSQNVPPNVAEQIKTEHEYGITTAVGLLKFQDTIDNHVKECKKYLETIVKSGKRIVGFGASGRSNIFFNMMGIDTGLINYVFDESDERSNRFIPNCNIPIVKFDEEAASIEYDVVLISAWNYFEQIRNKIKAKEYVVLFPKPKKYQ